MKSEVVSVLKNKLDLGLKSRFPMIHQTESSECGLACLAMICGYYGKNIDIFTLRQKFNLSSRGTDLASLNDIAVKMHMSTRAVSVELDELHSVKLPCILHWDFNHFVVLTKIKNGKFTIHDPSVGIVKVAKSELSKKFTGIILEIWPDNNFLKENVKNPITIRSLSTPWERTFTLLLSCFIFLLICLHLQSGYQLSLLQDRSYSRSLLLPFPEPFCRSSVRCIHMQC